MVTFPQRTQSLEIYYALFAFMQCPLSNLNALSDIFIFKKMKLLPLFVSSSFSLDVPESCLYCDAFYIEGIGLIEGSMDCFEGKTRFYGRLFVFLISGKHVESKTNTQYPICYTETRQLTFGEGLNVYAIWRDTDEAYFDEAILGA